MNAEHDFPPNASSVDSSCVQLEDREFVLGVGCRTENGEMLYLRQTEAPGPEDAPYLLDEYDKGLTFAFANTKEATLWLRNLAWREPDEMEWLREKAGRELQPLALPERFRAQDREHWPRCAMAFAVGDVERTRKRLPVQWKLGDPVPNDEVHDGFVVCNCPTDEYEIDVARMVAEHEPQVTADNRVFDFEDVVPEQARRSLHMPPPAQRIDRTR